MTKLFLTTNLEKFENAKTSKLINKMPPNRIEKFTKLPKQKKFECLAGFLFAVFCIENNFKTKKPLEFSRKNGKPQISNHKNIFFNISHTKNAIACAVSTNEIGVDIEKKTRLVDFNLAKRICCNHELEIFKTLNIEKTNFLLKTWTSKESFAKMKAEGIFSNIKTIDAMKIKNLKTFRFHEYILSICGLCPIGLVKPVLVDFKAVLKYALKCC